MIETETVARTRQWISSLVIGLGLCPFAKKVFDAGTIRYVVSDACEGAVLLDELASELRSLVATPITETETTLLIHPQAFPDFYEYLDFVEIAEQLIDDLGFTGVIQLASFHPGYQFAETAINAVENYTNRSPYPMLHLLREESVTEVAGNPDELLEIPKRNIRTLQSLGIQRVLEKLNFNKS